MEVNMDTKYKFAYSIKDGYLFKKAKKSKHFLESPEAIAVDKDVFKKAVKMSHIIGVKVYEVEHGVTYIASLENFIINSILIDRGFGEQYALPLEYWEKEGKGFVKDRLL
jgi:hypothetical protein